MKQVCNYENTRKEEILADLAGEKLLTEKELYKSEELPAYQSFVDALYRNIAVPEGYTAPMDTDHLAGNMRKLAAELGLQDDGDVIYAAKQVERLVGMIHNMRKGLKGEEIAKRAMFSIEAPNRILTNKEFTMDDMPFEIDALVINQNGICVVEVKDIRQNLVINENGVMVPENGANGYQCDIRMKLNNAVTVIRRILERAFPDNPKMMNLANHIQVTLFTTGGNIVDSRKELTVANRNNIVDILNGFRCEDTALSREEINAIATAVEDAAQVNRYKVGWNYRWVAHAYATAVAKLEYAAEHHTNEIVLPHSISDDIDSKDETMHTSDEDAMVDEDNTSLNTPKEKHHYKRKIAAALALIAAVGVGLVFGKSDY